MNYNIHTQVNYNIYTNLSNNEKVDTCISEVVYQENFLDAFYLTEYDEKVVGPQQDILFGMLKTNEQMIEILNNLSKKLDLDDNEFLFIYLFSYPLFFVMHKIICYFLNNGEITNDLVEEINIEIEKL